MTLLAHVGIDRAHESVNHSVGEYVRGMAHMNGMESHWAMLKRGFDGTYQKMSPKHLHRCVKEFAGRHNVREEDTLEQMREMMANMEGRSLPYKFLKMGNGLPSGPR